MISETLRLIQFITLWVKLWQAYFTLIDCVLAGFGQRRAKQVIFQSLEFINLLGLFPGVRWVSPDFFRHREQTSVCDRVETVTRCIVPWRRASASGSSVKSRCLMMKLNPHRDTVTKDDA